MEWIIVLVMLLVSLVGLALVLLGLPGIWLMVFVGLIVQILRPEHMGWWPWGIAAGLALAAELAEALAGGAGAKAAGSSKRAIFAAIAGGLIGGLVGTFAIPIPLIGTVAGSAIGAGVGAASAELTLRDRPMEQIFRVGKGAAIGRLIAVVIKVGFGVAAAVILTLAPLF